MTLPEVDLADPALLSPLRWEAETGRLWLLDQRCLPAQERWLPLARYTEVVRAISDMAVRGAPAIGIAAAYGVVLGAREGAPLPEVMAALSRTRPTAVNLFWALRRMEAVARAHGGDAAALEREALAIHREDAAACLAMGRHGAPLLPPGTVLTHCNAGALATGGYGTALGVIRAAVAAGLPLRVLATETRPFLQGARLTCWELQKSGIDVTLITDGMAGHLMARGEVQAVLVGADRIARSGDVANKIGTYSLAVLAREHGLPFYVAAPRSTLDLATARGADIPIEERASEEVTHLGGVPVAPPGVPARHPAFDVTPARLVAAIITEAGVARPPYEESLPRLLGVN
ncbi:MAG: S-methyl-5-thioribose-1-phosphate isomerase [Myxococcales bacterium]|nr:S-methyl-5-thioribose-1-phosphate isomerase [Myxococcota bacterium]MDW8283260.1 S-methyl-5-thioribose-1-phosphate isomerase [Myxococcales bacterium]